MDREWLRQLAQARTDQGRLVPNNPEETKRDAMRHLMSAAATLQQEAEECCAIFNMYAPKEQMHILPLAATPGRVLPPGFMILLGGRQIRIEQNEYMLRASLLYIEAFQQKEKLLHMFEAKVDMFGGITWIMDKKNIVTNEMILKTLLRSLREAGEARKA